MSKLETIEWSQIWFDNTTKEKSILLIGDSITNGYFDKVANYFRNDFDMIKYATSKAIDNPTLLKETEEIIEQVGASSVKVIHVNNGLHGIGMSDEDYEKFFDVFLYNLREICPDAVILIANSTPITTPSAEFVEAVNNKVVIRRNECVEKLGKKYGYRVEDLYSLVYGNRKIKSDDGYHYNAEGYQLLADLVADSIRKEL